MREIYAAEDERRRFVHEAKAASALDHPHTITVHAVGCDDGQDGSRRSWLRGNHSIA
jgi:hypothetical protein